MRARALASAGLLLSSESSITLFRALNSWFGYTEQMSGHNKVLPVQIKTLTHRLSVGKEQGIRSNYKTMRDTLAYHRDLICSVDRRRLSTANRLDELRSWILVEEKMQFNKLSDIWNDLGERSTAVMNLHMNMYWKNVGNLQRRNRVEKMIDGRLSKVNRKNK